MIPRLHARGQSFKGACAYVLHDPGTQTTDRVLWAETINLDVRPDEAWRRMHATWKDRVRLKRAAGVDLRGRDNTKPVLHLTLSWHADDEPTPEHMRKSALEALAAIGLGEHQALIAAHIDKSHAHVHLIVNTVDPSDGRTAAMKYTKERLSKWAQAYEKEHGLRCEQRVRNNEARENAKARRKKDPVELLIASGDDKDEPIKAPFVPVRDRSPNRRQWFEKREIIDRMRAMRARFDEPHRLQRGVLSARHRQSRDRLWLSAKEAMEHARQGVYEQNRPKWTTLYRRQRREERHLRLVATHPFERAVFVFSNRTRLGLGKPLNFKNMVGLVLNGRRLSRAVGQVHERERRALAQDQKAATRDLSDRIMSNYRVRSERLKSEQAEERQAQWREQKEQTSAISFVAAKEELIAEQPADAPEPRAFRRDEPDSAASRVEQIRRDMEEWRRRNRGRDPGREL